MRIVPVAVGVLLLVVVFGLAWIATTGASGRDAVSTAALDASEGVLPRTELVDAAPDSATHNDKLGAEPIEDLRDDRNASQQRQALPPEPRPTTLEVHVFAKESGIPLAGVRLLLWPSPRQGATFSLVHRDAASATFGESPVTDGAGVAKFDVPAGRGFRLDTDGEAVVEATTTEIEPLGDGEVRVVDLHLLTQPNARFVLQVLENQTGLPLPRAWSMRGENLDVLRSEVPGPNEPGWTRQRADSGGYIELDVGSWERGLVRVDAPEHAWVAVPLSPNHADRSSAREVRLRRASSLDVLVLGVAGRAVSGARVVCTTEPHLLQAGSEFEIQYLSDPVTWTARTDRQGRARFEVLPPSVPLALSCSTSEGHVPPPSQLIMVPGEHREVEIQLERGGLLQGWLRSPSGSPIPGAEVWLIPGPEGAIRCFSAGLGEQARRTRTSNNGEFIFKDVVDGAWNVGCSPESVYRSSVLPVVLSGGITESQPVLIAEKGEYVRGRVVTPSGEPCSAWVSAEPVDSGCTETRESEADGSFSVGPLRPGTYVLDAFFGRGPKGAVFAPSSSLTVHSGSEDVVLVLRAGAKIAGRVVHDDTGQGVAAEVTLRRIDELGEWSWTSYHHSQEDGSFEFEGIPEGNYALTASTESGLFGAHQPVSVSTGSARTGIAISTQPGARLNARYEGKSRMAYISVRKDGVLVAVESLEFGTEVTFTVPAGSLDVACEEWPRGSSELPTKHVEVVAGEMHKVVFDASNE